MVMTTELIEAFCQTDCIFGLFLGLLVVYCMQKLFVIEMTNNNNIDNRYNTRKPQLRSAFIQ
jgi:hypothetical protein